MASIIVCLLYQFSCGPLVQQYILNDYSIQFLTYEKISHLRDRICTILQVDDQLDTISIHTLTGAWGLLASGEVFIN